MNLTSSIALLDRRELQFHDWNSVLSPREQAEAATFSNPVRRERNIASRLIVKYLLTRPNAKVFQQAGAAEMEAARDSAWQSIELLSGTAGNRVDARIMQGGNECPDWSASSSHCGPYTASIVGRCKVGLDLESVEPRRAEFYANMFSAE